MVRASRTWSSRSSRVGKNYFQSYLGNQIKNWQQVSMILFYTDNIDGKIAHLDTEQARHCVQVLRKQEGDAISFVDGTYSRNGKEKMCYSNHQNPTSI